MTIKERIAAQVFSGKWLLTVTAGAVLMVITVTDCMLALQGKKLFVEPGALLPLITAVIMAYFGKPQEPVQPAAPVDDPEALKAFAKKLEAQLGQPRQP